MTPLPLPSNLFPFEREEFSDLNWMPLACRYRLDVSGLKLSLAGWQALSFSERLALLDSPFDSEAERVAWVSRLKSAVAAFGFEGLLKELEPWSDIGEIPPEVREKLTEAGLQGQIEWTGLKPLQRYALFKLAKSRQSGRYFPLAVAEFCTHS